METRHSILAGALAVLALSAIAHADGLVIEGVLESKSGFRFPDGSLMTSAAQQFDQYSNILVVAEAGGDFDTIQDAIDSVTNASNINKYLVWVAPGNYDGGIVLKPYVDLKGAGRESTRIVMRTGGTVVQMGNNSELSSLELNCSDTDNPAPACIGLLVENAPDGALVQDVHIEARIAQEGGGAEGVRVVPGATTPSNLEMRDVYVLADAPRAAAFIGTASTTTSISDSELRLADSSDSDTVRVVAGGTLNVGHSTIANYSGYGGSRAVYLTQGANATFRDSIIEARDGYTCVAIKTENAATMKMERSRVAAIQCTNSEWGILSQGDGADLNIDVSHSDVYGSDYAVFNPLNPSNVVFRFTALSGGPALGNIKCLFASEETLDPLLGEDECP